MKNDQQLWVMVAQKLTERISPEVENELQQRMLSDPDLENVVYFLAEIWNIREPHDVDYLQTAYKHHQMKIQKQL